MLTIKHGNLFEHVKERAIIVHGCNAQGKMGSGFAKLIADKYPGAKRRYLFDHSQGACNVGDVSWYFEWPELLIIANAITQQYYGYDGRQYVSYEGSHKALTEVKEFAQDFTENLTVHFPFIGTGLAGGDKNKMLAIFTDVFDDTDIDATLWIKE